MGKSERQFSPDKLKQFAASIKEDLLTMGWTARKMHEEGIRKLREFAGSEVDRMLANRMEAEAYLDNANPELRFAALAVLTNYWRPTERVAKRCEQLLAMDGDTKVRGMAIICLGEYYGGTGDPRVARLLARIVSSASEPQELRETAYRRLFYLVKELPLSLPHSVEFRFPDQVDWDFVNSFDGD